MHQTAKRTGRIAAAVGSNTFFRVLVGVLVLEAAWIAISGRYPMAFDEDFHLGIIRLYAQHWWPFWSAQPADASTFGAVWRDPSYLYHFLMSFPYRLINAFTHDTTIQVLWLRAINIGLFACGLPLYRRLLLRTGASRTIVNVCLAAFVLIPMVPLLAAQINYDNLLLPVVAGLLLLTLNFSDRLRQKRLDAGLLIAIFSVGMLASLIKYAFLPIFMAILLFIAFRMRQTYPVFGKMKQPFVSAVLALGRRKQWLLGLLLILSLGLFVERYGVNIVRYHSPVPDCGQVLTIEECSNYGPWGRDYHLSNSKANSATKSPLTFSADWLYGMWLRSFFAVDGPGTSFQTRGPLVLPGIGAIIFVGIGIVAVALKSRQVWRTYRRDVLGLFAVTTICYIVILWLDEYREFLHTGQPVAINGRYLLPVLLPLMLIAALSINELLARREALKIAFGGVVIACLLWGGGALTYVLRSNDAWYWPAAPQPVYDVNHAIQHVVGPITPGYKSPSQFLGHN